MHVYIIYYIKLLIIMTYIDVTVTPGNIAAVAGGVVGGIVVMLLIILGAIVLLMVLRRMEKSEFT